MDVLEIQRADKEVREQAAEQEGASGRRAGQRANRENAQRDERVPEARLERDEGRQERDCGAAEPDRVRRGPAVVRRRDDVIDAEHQRGGDQNGARDVHAVAQTQSLVLFDQPGAEDHRGDADRHVDEEDPVPVDPLGQEPAGEQTQRAAARDDQREDAHRLRALRRLLKLRDDDGDDHARGQRATEALQEAADDQVVRALGEPGPDRRDGEEEDPGQEDLAAPDQVTQPSRHQEEAPVGDQVGVDDPGQAGRGEA